MESVAKAGMFEEAEGGEPAPTNRKAVGVVLKAPRVPVGSGVPYCSYGTEVWVRAGIMHIQK